MVPITEILFLIISLMLLIAVGIYAIKAAQGIASLGKQDSVLGSAHKYAVGAAIASILGATLIIGLIIAYFIYTRGSSTRDLSTPATVMLAITLVLILLSGILTAIVAARMNSSSAGSAAIRKAAYNDAVIATLLGIIGFVLISGILIALRVYQHRKKQRELATIGAKLEHLSK